MDPTYHDVYPTLYQQHWWWRVREEILLEMIGRLPVGAARRRILDVGCGAGLFFDALERLGDVQGIESDVTAVARSGRWQPRITVGELNAQTTFGASFDLVLLLDVLEHVPTPEVLLRHVERMLAPGGAVLITVPAFSWLWTQHDVLNHHLTRYTVRQLGDLVTASGLRACEGGYLFQSLVGPKLLVRAVEWMRPRSPQVPTVPPAWLNAAARRWFRFEYRVLGALPFGGSAWLIARRPQDAATDNRAEFGPR